MAHQNSVSCFRWGSGPSGRIRTQKMHGGTDLNYLMLFLTITHRKRSTIIPPRVVESDMFYFILFKACQK